MLSLRPSEISKHSNKKNIKGIRTGGLDVCAVRQSELNTEPNSGRSPFQLSTDGPLENQNTPYSHCDLQDCMDDEKHTGYAIDDDADHSPEGQAEHEGNFGNPGYPCEVCP